MTQNINTDGVLDGASTPTQGTHSAKGQGKKTLGSRVGAKVGTVVLGASLAFGPAESSTDGRSTTGKIINEGGMPDLVATQVYQQTPTHIDIIRDAAPKPKNIKKPSKKPSRQSGNDTTKAPRGVVNLQVAPDLPNTSVIVSPEQREAERLEAVYQTYSHLSYKDMLILMTMRRDYLSLQKMAIDRRDETFAAKLLALSFDRVAYQERTYAFYGKESAERNFDQLIKSNFEFASMVAETVLDQSRRDLYAKRLIKAMSTEANTVVISSAPVPSASSAVSASTPGTSSVASAPVSSTTSVNVQSNPVQMPKVQSVAIPAPVDTNTQSVKTSVSGMSDVVSGVSGTKTTAAPVPAPAATAPVSTAVPTTQSTVTPTTVSAAVPVTTTTVATSQQSQSDRASSQASGSISSNTLVKASGFHFSALEAQKEYRQNLDYISKIKPKLPLTGEEGAKEIEGLNVSLERKLYVLTELAMHVDTTFAGTQVEQFGFEQRIAMLAHAIIHSRQIKSIDMVVAALSEIVHARQNASNKNDVRSLSDAKSVISFLHAVFITAGQQVFANELDLVSDKSTGEARRKEICSRLGVKDKERICYSMLLNSALQDDPKMVIGAIARKVDDSVYNKFLLVYPSVELYYKNKKK